MLTYPPVGPLGGRQRRVRNPCACGLHGAMPGTTVPCGHPIPKGIDFDLQPEWRTSLYRHKKTSTHPSISTTIGIVPFIVLQCCPSFAFAFEDLPHSRLQNSYSLLLATPVPSTMGWMRNSAHCRQFSRPAEKRLGKLSARDKQCVSSTTPGYAHSLFKRFQNSLIYLFGYSICSASTPL